jgi:hypothetical protein
MSWGKGGAKTSVDIGYFSEMPRYFFGSGCAAKLGTSTSLLFLALCEHANRNSSNSFAVSDLALASDTGLAPRTICEARKRLIEERLISCVRESGRSFTYTLSKYEFRWVGMKERPRMKRRARALHSMQPVTSAKLAEPPSPQSNGPSPKFAEPSRKVC